MFNRLTAYDMIVTNENGLLLQYMYKNMLFQSYGQDMLWMDRTNYELASNKKYQISISTEFTVWGYVNIHKF